MVRVCDLPLAGRPTCLRWRMRRLRCEGCRRSLTETHPELPTRQRVTAPFRRRLLERVRRGGAHADVAREEQTSCYRSRGPPATATTSCRPITRPGRRGGCRSTRHTIVVARPDRRPGSGGQAAISVHAYETVASDDREEPDLTATPRPRPRVQVVPRARRAHSQVVETALALVVIRSDSAGWPTWCCCFCLIAAATSGRIEV